MTVTVKNSQTRHPRRDQAPSWFRLSQKLQLKASGGIINIIPELPSADDEYTPEQRRVIDSRLKEGLADIKAGRTYGPFDTADEMVTHMKGQLKKRVAAKKFKRGR